MKKLHTSNTLATIVEEDLTNIVTDLRTDFQTQQVESYTFICTKSVLAAVRAAPEESPELLVSMLAHNPDQLILEKDERNPGQYLKMSCSPIGEDYPDP